MTKPLAPCGTESAYQRHRRRGEPQDPECLAAHAARGRTPDRREYFVTRRRIEQRARRMLRELYPAEYEAHAAAKHEELPPSPLGNRKAQNSRSNKVRNHAFRELERAHKGEYWDLFHMYKDMES